MFFVGVMFVLCNFRLLLLYTLVCKSASTNRKIITFANVRGRRYSIYMSFFVKATQAPVTKTLRIRLIAIVYAAFIAVFAVCQLVTFVDFSNVIHSFWLASGEALGRLVPALIIVIEIGSLPFLLRMRLSPAMRVISMICSWLFAVMWIKISIWILISVNAVHNIGFLGNLVPIMPGLGTFLVSILFAVLAVWISWGMWPRHRK
jgi:hypothetical protein